MKGKLTAIGIIFAILIFTPLTLSIILPSNGPSPPPPPPNNQDLVYIYVESSIHDLLFTDLTQYKIDVQTQGYDVELITWYSTDVNALKNNLSNAYQQGLVGAVLIGDLPYATARHLDTSWWVYRHYPCDLFLMDLDGNWSDTVIPNGIFDIDQNEHNNGTGDWTPEIWISRITPSSIGVPGYNYTAAYKSYFTSR